MEYARTPTVEIYDYRRLEHHQEHEYGPVTFALMREIDAMKIAIASDWQQGRQLSQDGKDYSHTGYIGEGHTKFGIYVSHLRPELLRCLLTVCLEGTRRQAGICSHCS